MVLDDIRDSVSGGLGAAAGHGEAVAGETGTEEQAAAIANEVSGGLDQFQGVISDAVAGDSNGSDPSPDPSGGGSQTLLIGAVLVAAAIVAVGWS